MIRMRLLPSLLMAVLACTLGLAVSSAFSQQATRHPVGVCYATDGTSFETTYVTGGASFYPIASSGEVEQTETGFVTIHRVVFEERGRLVYLPMIAKE